MLATIAELNFAPGKGMAPYEDVGEIIVGPDGLVDRYYMWVEAAQHTNVLFKRGKVVEAGHYLSTREDPKLSQVAPVLRPEGGVTLGLRGSSETWDVPPVEDVAERRIPVSVHSWHGEAIDQGDDAAEWGAEILGRPVRLVAVSHNAPRWVEDDPALGRVGFADGYPVTVGSTRSLELVNRQLAQADHQPITGQWPRVTMLLDGLELPNRTQLPEDVFPEDYIESIQIGSDGLALVLKRRKNCGRCPVPDTNPLTGERNGSPVRRALGRLGRRGRHLNEAYGTDPELFWTQNFAVELPQGMDSNDRVKIPRNAQVEVTYSLSTNWAPC